LLPATHDTSRAFVIWLDNNEFPYSEYISFSRSSQNHNWLGRHWHLGLQRQYRRSTEGECAEREHRRTVATLSLSLETIRVVIAKVRLELSKTYLLKNCESWEKIINFAKLYLIVFKLQSGLTRNPLTLANAFGYHIFRFQ
jgi:hypothetical protein